MSDVELFKAIDGLRFCWKGHAYQMRAGVYQNGAGAMFVASLDTGEKIGNITVNMESEHATLDLAPEEFCVKWDGDLGAASLTEHYAMVACLGLFEDTARRLRGGFLEHYAAIWRFAKCDEEHEGYGDARVTCLDCRLRLKTQFEAKIEQALARDATKRLRSMKGE